jgi:hypothetical protein
MLSACRIKPAALQVELHPLLAQRKLVGVCKRKGLAIIAHHPLGDANLATNAAVIKVAGECSRKPVEVSIPIRQINKNGEEVYGCKATLGYELVAERILCFWIVKLPAIWRNVDAFAYFGPGCGSQMASL